MTGGDLKRELRGVNSVGNINAELSCEILAKLCLSTGEGGVVDFDYGQVGNLTISNGDKGEVLLLPGLVESEVVVTRCAV